MKYLRSIPTIFLLTALLSHTQAESYEEKGPQQILGVPLEDYRSAKSILNETVDAWIESEDSTKRLAAYNLLIEQFRAYHKVPKARQKENNDLLLAASTACEISLLDYASGDPELIELVHSLPVWDSTRYWSLYRDFDSMLDVIVRAEIQVAELPSATVSDVTRVMALGTLDGAPAEMIWDGYVGIFKVNPQIFLRAVATLKPEMQNRLGDFMDPTPFEDPELLESVTKTMQENDHVCVPDSPFEVTLKERLRLGRP